MHNWIMVGLLLGLVALSGGLYGLSGKQTKKQKKRLLRILVAAAAALCLQLWELSPFAPGRFLRLGGYLAAYFLIGHDILRKALLGIRNRRVFDENFLMAIATVGALTLAAAQNGDYLEAIMVMLLYQLGEWFQSYAVGKSRRSIAALMDIRPDYANIEKDGTLIPVSPEQVPVGSCIVVQPGERIPIDAVVEAGSVLLDTAALTGESLPRQVAPGDAVISGCICTNGVLTLRTTKPFAQSTVSRILELVEDAGARKSRSEAFISKFARIYTPAVCIGALLLAVLPPLVCILAGWAANWAQWLYRALTFLVISCPCALVISVPLSFFAGIGGASREGILIKGSNFLEALSKTDCVVLDKTGTLTQGVFQVTQVLPQAPLDTQQLLQYAAMAECASSHPIAQSLIQAYGSQPDRSRVADIREHGGMGVTATVDGSCVAVGSERLMEQLGIDRPAKAPGTVVYVAVDGHFGGSIVISDVLKPQAKESVRQLKQQSIRQLVMLTGDAPEAAEQTAREVGIDTVHSRLLPADKVAWAERLMEQKRPGTTLVFVGDGINDAPVLARADVGVAMGAIGSDAAIEAADVVLMDDDPLKLPRAIRIAKKCMGIVYQNIVFALGVKLICLALGALGWGDLYLAIFADVGVMVLAVLNAIRCLHAAGSVRRQFERQAGSNRYTIGRAR